MSGARDEHETLRTVRARYFEDAGLAPDGGYGERWVRFRLGPVPVAFPNLAMRVKAVRFHDLHHVVTGYGTDVVGEAEIGAWEIASGCEGHAAALGLNLYAMTIGLLRAPGRVWQAFVRGRHSLNLYGEAYDDALLETRLGEMRERLLLRAEPAAATARDRAAFAMWAGAAVAFSLASWIAPVVLLVVALRAA